MNLDKPNPVLFAVDSTTREPTHPFFDTKKIVGPGGRPFALTNAEIAATLVISELTVKSHIGRTFAKLGLRAGPPPSSLLARSAGAPVR